MARLDLLLKGEVSFWSWALDQFLHGIIGFAIAVPFALWLDRPWLGIAIASGVGLIREIIQLISSGKLHALDRSVDALFWFLGALIVLVF